MEENRDYYSLQDVINTSKLFLKYLRRKWWLLALAIIAGGGLGTAYYFRQKPKYEAVTTFILEDKSSSNSGLAGLASQFGFNLGSLSSGGSMFAGDNILTILKSKKVVEQVLLSEVDSNTNRKSLADYYLEFTGIKKSWKKSKVPIDFNFTDVKNGLTPKADSVLNDIYTVIVKKHLKAERISKQGNIIQVKATGADCIFAHLLSERAVEEAGKLYLEVKTSIAQANIDQLQHRSDSLLYLLNRKSYSAAMSQGLDFNPGIKSATVPGEIENRDKTVAATLYAEITKNLELSRLILSQQTPVIQVLDKSPELLSDNKKGLTFLILVFSFLSFVFFFVLLGVAYFLKGAKNT